MIKAYRLITTAGDLKLLHDEANLNGVKEVGVSKGRILYAWDEDRNNLRSITTEEAADRLGLTTRQVDKIIETLGEVDFEPEVAEETTPEDTYIIEAEEIYTDEPKAEEPKAEEPEVEEPEVEEPEVEEPEVEEPEVVEVKNTVEVDRDELTMIVESLEYALDILQDYKDI